jgi:hypothetical protein
MIIMRTPVKFGYVADPDPGFEVNSAMSATLTYTVLYVIILVNIKLNFSHFKLLALADFFQIGNVLDQS